MPLQATSGAASYDAFGGGVAAIPNYIEDVFSTWLYTGNVTPLAITNGIDLSTYGGLIWTKERNNTASHLLIDSQRGLSGGFLRSNTTDAADTSRVSESISSFNTDGYSLHAPDTLWDRGSYNYVSWTFRKQPKFFDVVTLNYTSGAAVFNHSLGSVPGFVILKVSSGYADNWWVYHRSLGNDQYVNLNLTSAAQTSTGIFSATDTTFTVKNGIFGASTIVAYLFAHNAGGFGLTGTDNVISCGSFTFAYPGPTTVNLGYEPQWILYKNVNDVDNWTVIDNMRGMTVGGSDAYLRPNTSGSEGSFDYITPTSTGFVVNDGVYGSNYIYIAIRRGPMKVPTSGTSVFTTRVATEVEYNNTADYGITTDLLLNRYYKDGSQYTMSFDRLRGSSKILYTPLTDAEGSLTLGAGNLGFGAGQTSVTWAQIANFSLSNVTWAFRRAPSFFDEVCYKGTNSGGSSQTIPHNLGVAPELLIFKKRGATSNWTVVMPAIGGNAVSLNLNDYGGNSNIQFIDTFGTSSITTASGYDTLSENTTTYVAYLFATCAGVSKVGNYTGTGAALTVNCGFTSGARFVMIKRLDGTNIYRGWYVWDSARGITSGNDPYLLMNNTDAETTGTNYVDSASSGFTLTTDSAGASGGALNASGGTYIFLAIA